MEPQKDFYAREIEGMDLGSVIAVHDTEKKADVQNITPRSLDYFNGSEELITRYYDQHQDMFFSLVDSLNIGCSFLRIYTDFKKINALLTKNAEEVKKSKIRKKEISEVLYQALQDYQKKISQDIENRKFDAGDKARVRYEEHSNPTKGFKYYYSERDKVFPRGSSGIITAVFRNSNCQVYFNEKIDYTPKNGDEIKDEEYIDGQWGRDLKKELKNWLVALLPEKNLAEYLCSELQFIPPNQYEFNMLYQEWSKLRDITDNLAEK